MALVETCSAAVGTTIATLAFYPVDLVKTRYQAQVGDSNGGGLSSNAPASATDVVLQILREEGVLGLYRGLTPYLAKDILTVGSLFFWKYIVTELYVRSTNRQPRILEGLLLGMAGGAVNQCIMLPTDRITVCLQVDQSRPSVLQVVQNIYNDGGLGAFWTGLAPSLILTANPAITFTAFDNLKQRVAPLLSRTAQSLTILQSFVLAMVSKTLALILTYPLIRAKVVMLGRLRQLALENSGGSKPKQHKRNPGLVQMMATLSEILTKEGTMGLYKGFAAQFWLSVLSSGLLLMVKDQIGELVALLLQRRLVKS
jgi:hypothetical protein